MSRYLGDYTEDDMLYFTWSTNDADGASITRTTDGTVSVYKDNNVTQSVAGITDTEDFDGLTGIHLCTIDLSNDVFYATGADYSVVLSGASIDGKAVNAVLAHFSIENRFMVDISELPTTSEFEDRTLPNADYVVVGDTIAGVTLVATTTDVTNPVTADVTAISGDSTAADNLEAQYDGVTGLSGDLYPSTQAQVGNIASGTAATNTVSGSFVGIPSDEPIETLTYESTHALDGITHDLAPNAGTGFTDCYYEFNVGGNGVPVSIQWEGYANSVGDEYLFYAYNWVGTSWDQVGSKAGLSGSTIVTIQSDLTTAHVGTGANIGLVRFRIYSTGGTTGTNISTDRILCSFSTVFQSVGYANGSIWIDTLLGTSGAVPYVNGTADNPSDNLTDALALSVLLSIRRFQIVSGSTIDLIADATGMVGVGENWNLALEGQLATEATVIGATITGNANVATTGSELLDCHFDTAGVGVGHTPSTSIRCGLRDEIRLLAAGTYVFMDCYSEVAGTGTPSLDFGSGIGASAVNFRDYSGGIEIKNMTTGDTMSLEGDGQLVINASCDAGIIAIRGNFTVTDNAGGAVTLSDEARYDQTQILNAVIDDSTLIDASTLNTLSSHDPGETLGTADPGDEMDLIDDAITAAKYDESTAFPLTAVNGSTLTEAGGDGDHLSALPNQTMDITGTVSGNSTHDAADVLAAMEADNTLLDYLATDLIYKKSITIANGDSIQYNKSNVLIGTIGGSYADDGTTVFRKNQTQIKV